MQNWIFRIITPVFSVTWQLYAEETILLIVNVENSNLFINKNVFNATFDQLNSSLKKKKLAPKQISTESENEEEEKLMEADASSPNALWVRRLLQYHIWTCQCDSIAILSEHVATRPQIHHIRAVQSREGFKPRCLCMCVALQTPMGDNLESNTYALVH